MEILENIFMKIRNYCRHYSCQLSSTKAVHPTQYLAVEILDGFLYVTMEKLLNKF